MKIKADFVTNSSTTSFVVWGADLGKDNVCKNKKLMEAVFNKWTKDGGNKDDITLEQFLERIDEDGLDYDYFDYIEELASPLETSFGPYGEDLFWIGGSPNKMRDDQTLGDYKKEILEKLKQMGFDVKKLEFISEAWMDG